MAEVARLKCIKILGIFIVNLLYHNNYLMNKNESNEKQQYEDLGEVELNQRGQPKQAVVLYQLTPDMIDHAKEQIQKDTILLPENRYEEAKTKAAKVWDTFYSSHKCNFFKDRNYLEREIKEIKYFRQKHEQQKKTYTYCELGCGVGNTIFPLLRQYKFFNYQGFDISAQAIKLIESQMQNHPEYQQRLQVKVCDLVKDQIPFQVKPDLLSMIFVLSAIVPEKHQQVINKIAKWMKPGSCFFFRDYGRYDFGQVNMSNKGNRKLQDNFYVKHDGVCVYYFQQKELQKLFENAGLIKVEGSIHCRLLQNRKTGLKMYRIWVQGRFYKPPIDPFFLERIQAENKKVEKVEQKKKETCLEQKECSGQKKQQKGQQDKQQSQKNVQAEQRESPSKKDMQKVQNEKKSPV